MLNRVPNDNIGDRYYLDVKKLMLYDVPSILSSTEFEQMKTYILISVLKVSDDRVVHVRGCKSNIRIPYLG